MKVRSLAPWFGGKRSLAAEIVEQLGKHTQYLEPFCGSMAVLMQKPPCQLEIVNDLHGGIVLLARVVASASFGPQLEARLERTLFCEDLFRTAYDFVRRHPPSLEGMVTRPAPDHAPGPCPSQPARCVPSSRRRNSDTPNRNPSVRWKTGGGSGPIRFRNAVESMGAWRERLQGVTILRRDGFECLERFADAEDAAIYVDPPYCPETRTGWNAAGATSRYQHEFQHESDLFAPDDHSRLRSALNRFQHARIVVSYYDCPRVRRLYQGWRFIDVGRQKNLKRSTNAEYSEAEAPEVLIVNC